jgi:hypothetical protein
MNDQERKALELAEEALAIKASLRDTEQAKVQRALEAVREVINGPRSAPINGYGVFNGGQGD